MASARSGRVRMNLAVARINHQPLEVRLNNQTLEQLLPYATVTPTAKPAMGVLPIPEAFRQIAPRRTGAQNPKHRIEKPAVVLGHSTPLTGLTRQMRLKKCSSSIVNIVPMN